MDSRTLDRIKQAKFNIEECLKNARVHEVELELGSLTDYKETMEANKVYQDL